MKSQDKTDQHFMHAAINQALKGKTAFGCVIAGGNEIVAEAHNTAKTDKDPTAHAEINAIRKLAKIPEYKSMNLTLYTTGEPCPMCMSAIVFAGIRRVVFGVAIPEISNYRRQIMISSEEIAEKGFQEIEIKGGILYEECLNLFKTGNHDQR